MVLLLLVNTSDNDLLAMYDGQPFVVPARRAVPAPADAARHIADNYSSRGVVLVYSQEEADALLSNQEPPVHADEDEDVGDDQPSEEDGSSVCPECGEDFSDKRRPGHALRLHRRRAHNATV